MRARLIDKLRAIEALFAGATTAGEQVAADLARQRIKLRLQELETEDAAEEYQFSLGDIWSRKVFCALLRRYDLKPYRCRRQRYTTVMVRASKQFVDETLWPEYQQTSKTLEVYLSDVTERVVSQVIHPDSSDAAVVSEQLQLRVGTSAAPKAPEARDSVPSNGSAPRNGQAKQAAPTARSPHGGNGEARQATSTVGSAHSSKPHSNKSRRGNKKRKQGRKRKRR